MSIYREDLATIKRQTVVEDANGENKNELSTIYSDIPCHLSIKKMPVVNQGNFAGLKEEFILFCDTQYKFELNDAVEVVTAGGQTHLLYAGISKNFRKTSQTKLSFDEVASV